jgi:hypothetical protein
MDIKEFLSPGDAQVDLPVSDKACLLKELADRAASSLSLPADRILSELLKRETLRSTGTGGGIAIPHARLPGLDKPFGILVRLRQPIDFNAIDSQPVDLLLSKGSVAMKASTLSAPAFLHWWLPSAASGKRGPAPPPRAPILPHRAAEQIAHRRDLHGDIRSAQRASLGSGKPVFLVPFIYKGPAKLGKVMVCWDGGIPAARALRRLQREATPLPFVFVPERGAPFTPAGLAKLVERAGVAARLAFKAHPHMLRHACGYALANKGHDTRALQTYLGHRNIQHTVDWQSRPALTAPEVHLTVGRGYRGRGYRGCGYRGCGICACYDACCDDACWGSGCCALGDGDCERWRRLLL